MRRPSRRLLASLLTPLFFAALLEAVAGCSTEVAATCQGANCGTGGSTTGTPAGTGGSGAACSTVPPGTPFTFHVHNAGAKPMRLTYGCGQELPVQLDTPSGPQGIGSGDCTFTCEAVYQGLPPGPFACSDCGAGMGVALDPGTTVDIPWDRRVYASQPIDPSCGGAGPGTCELAIAVAKAVAQTGVLTVCAEPWITGEDYGHCGTSADEQAVSFTIDTTGSEATIEVQ